MTDRELLELAAKAAGRKWLSYHHTKGLCYRDESYGGLIEYYWNPLTDDGDALRLAVKLRMFTDFESLCAQVDGHGWFGGGDDPEAGMSPDECDPYAAARKAIVRAAAEIGSVHE